MPSFIGKIRLILTIGCDDASQLASEATERRLAWYERWALRGHLLCCWSCRQFSRQIRFLSSAMRRLSDRESLPTDDESLRLDEAAKTRLKSLLHNGGS